MNTHMHIYTTRRHLGQGRYSLILATRHWPLLFFLRACVSLPCVSLLCLPSILKYMNVQSQFSVLNATSVHRAFTFMAHLHQRANTRTSSSCIIIHGFLWKPSTPRPRAQRVEKLFAKCHDNLSEYSLKSFQLNFYNSF